MLIIFLLVVASYKGYVFFYVCICRTLSNGFAIWNKETRAYFAARHKGEH